MNRLEAQRILFAANPARMALQSVEVDMAAQTSLTINIWRNHAIEPVWSLSQPYFQYGGWTVDAKLSDYDDTLAFAHHKPADLELLWLDSNRYLSATPYSDWQPWVQGRLRALRATTKVPIIVATWLSTAEHARSFKDSVESVAGCHFADLALACEDSAHSLIDPRSSSMAGTPLNAKVHALLARKLACHWLPAAVRPPIKAIAVDLDNTLHAGILGEDGVQGVQLSENHSQLQRQLLALRDRGIFIALVSRNEREDVQALFEARKDYPLRFADFSTTEVSWGDKGSAVARVAAALRIGTDALLFVDDNPGEVMAVATHLPNVHAILADAQAEDTARAIEFYPGLWRWNVSTDDARRVDDLRANDEREKLLAAAADPTEYFRSLNVKLKVSVDPTDQIKRLTDLCAKTNQFNLATRRFTEAEIAERLAREDSNVASVSLSDKLADSGVIAVVVGERSGSTLIVEELCVSCRAMGRQLEDAIVYSAIRSMPNFQNCREVAFRTTHAPRNQPALDWLAGALGQSARPEPGIHTLPADTIRQFSAPQGLALTLS